MARSILVCEDNPLIAADIADAVAEAGGRVCGFASSGAEALVMAGGLRPAIAVIDLTLSDGETGVDLALALDRVGCGIVLHSGASNADPRLASITHMSIAKPVSPETLRIVLETALAKLRL